MLPPIHRMLGFTIVFLSMCANIPVQFNYTNIYGSILLFIGLAFFSIFTYYTFKFLFVEHYTDDQKHHISVEYIDMIKDAHYVKIRSIMFTLYGILFLGSGAYSFYMTNSYLELTVWQKTMFGYNYFMSGFVIMYFYQHKFMDKYYSIKNVFIQNRKNNNTELTSLCERCDSVIDIGNIPHDV